MGQYYCHYTVSIISLKKVAEYAIWRSVLIIGHSKKADISPILCALVVMDILSEILNGVFCGGMFFFVSD